MTQTNIIECKAVSKAYGQNRVLDGVDLNVIRGEMLCIIGPSGSGKSTLLRCINRLEEIDSGQIRFHGLDGKIGFDDAIALRRKIGMVFQHFNLFPHMTVLENVMSGPRFALNQGRDEAAAKATRLLERVALGSKLASYPHELSGGQQQRVAIARALALDPEVMLFDEATSALDPELVGEVLEVMKRLAEDGMTMIVVTHQMSFAERFASRMAMFDAGKIIETGTPVDLLRNAREARTRAFLSQVDVENVFKD